ncbi:hypothetical protein [Providencia sp. PROV077]|uniref:hypothetical protein n=1 Tax=Providencia sp. PROV077 TaxID=2949799 RepID=UPI00234AFDBC|nr:hypothetical protein [Providencia sp. PROV077]MBZ3683333.1 hypothetical protein [Providencia rettgeri]
MKPLEREKIAQINKVNERRKNRSVKNGSIFFRYAFILMTLSYFAYPDIAKITSVDTVASLFITLIICSGSLWVAFLLIKPGQNIISKLNACFKK